ncbi:helix-turn-helix domain-containing protein [Amycolatopsis sp. NPDC051128]|uniref:helix-turn-helix domain-containing protein n=1 Tax=Amycolatopsis sp. NPDC051128 TaxID=3155412 RepID=UPI00341917DD
MENCRNAGRAREDHNANARRSPRGDEDAARPERTWHVRHRGRRGCARCRSSPGTAAGNVRRVLRGARTAEGLGLRRPAHKLGVSAQALSRWETGKRAPAIEDVAHVLGGSSLADVRS